MQNKLFRKESVDHISSPEQLHDYLRVTSPRLWMLLAAILVLVAGFLAYACTATMESLLDVTVSSDAGYLSAELPASQLDIVKIRMPLRIAGRTAAVSNISQDTRLHLEITFDGNTVLKDDYYELTFVNPEELPEVMKNDYFFLAVKDGEISTISSGVYEDFFQTDRRVMVNGNLGTVTSAKSFEVVSLSFSLEDDGPLLPDGVYPGQIVTESTTPISFLLN